MLFWLPSATLNPVKLRCQLNRDYMTEISLPNMHSERQQLSGHHVERTGSLLFCYFAKTMSNIRGVGDYDEAARRDLRSLLIPGGRYADLEDEEVWDKCLETC